MLTKRLEKSEIEEMTQKKRKILVISPAKQEEAQLEVIESDSEAKMEAFENLYDEAFDVTLPNVMWGIHRDSERKFIVFSTFDGEKMKFNKFLHINDRLKCKIMINEVSEEKTMTIEECNVEYVSDWLDEIDGKN